MSEQLKASLLESSFVDKAMQFAINRNPSILNIDKERVSRLVKNAALEMANFEEIALTRPLRIPETAEEARKIKVVWDVSGAGTYLKEFQDDRFKNIPWMGWMDRRRLNYSGALIRRLTERITGISYEVSLGKKLTPEQLEKTRSDIERFGPFLVYGATQEQNMDLEKELDEQGVIIPKSKVHIITDEVVNTIDQMKAFSLPDDMQMQEGDIIAVVAHAPHMVRILHMMNHFKDHFPKGIIVQPHPLPSPPSAGTDFSMMEISGLLYYTFISGDSSEESYPYQK